MQSNNQPFKSLYDVVTHVLNKQNYMRRDGVWVIGRKDKISPVNVGFNIEADNVTHLVVKGAYMSLYKYQFGIYTTDYEKTNNSFLPHNVNVSGYNETDGRDCANLIVHTNTNDDNNGRGGYIIGGGGGEGGNRRKSSHQRNIATNL